MTREELLVALGNDLWKADEDQLLSIAGILGWDDVRGLVHNTEGGFR